MVGSGRQWFDGLGFDGQTFDRLGPDCLDPVYHLVRIRYRTVPIGRSAA
jgi:hypothetical protein